MKLLVLLGFLSITTFSYAQNMSQTKEYRIKITIGNEVCAATLTDNATTRDFVQLLPFTVDMKDYNGTEKIFDPPKKLSSRGAPSGTDPDVGDITYYAPWGNIAIFYKDFGYSNSLIKLGKIDGSMDLFNIPGPLNAKIELLGK